MRTYITTEPNEKLGIVTIKTFIERITIATPKKAIEGWKKGVEYAVYVQPIDKRFCIYKKSGPVSEPHSGYKVYPSLEAIQNDFFCISTVEEIHREEKKIDKQPVKFSIK